MMDDGDELVPCPYNKSHVLYRSRMQTHLVKCRKAHENPQQNVDPVVMKVCTFNSNHHVPASEIVEHERTCKDGSTVQRFMIREGGGSVVPYNRIELPPADENWDADEYNATYNPEQHASTAVIIRQKQGVSKSARKSFRMQERERINRLREDQEAMEKSAKARPKPQPAEVVNSAFSENRLRQPRSAILGMGRGRILQPAQLPQNGDDLCEVVVIPANNHQVQDIPTVHSKAAGGIASTSDVAGVHRAPVSNGMCSPTSSGSRSIGSPVGMRCSRSNSQSDSSNSSDDGFIQQKSKKNRKKAQLPKVHGHVPSGNGQARNPLISNGGSLRHALPGQPGRGRGRLAKN